MITLTVAEILDLARCAGLVVEDVTDEDELETEVSVMACPEDGVGDEDEPDAPHDHYRFVAYFSDYPEEGVYGLGAAITKV